MEETTKRCNKCGRDLPTSSFSRKINAKDGLQDYCKDCQRDYNRQRYEKNKGTHCKKLSRVYTSPDLAKYQPRELLAELKARGYEWEKMFAPRQEVLYSKV